jgi:hypothetical protein
MTWKWKTRRTLEQNVYHPFIFAVVPIISLYVANIDEVDLSSIIRSLLLSILISALLFVITSVVLKDIHRAGLITSLVLLLFFSYGHLAAFIPHLDVNFPLFDFDRRVTTFAIEVLALWLVVLLLVVYKRSVFSYTLFVNITSMMFLLLLVGRIVIFRLYNINRVSSSSGATQVDIGSNNSSPDIYYIVLDGHAREDVLVDIYGYKDLWFTDELREMGFYVADKSTSNYSNTLVSIPATVNMKYINYLEGSVGKDSTDWSPSYKLFYESDVISIFAEQGYEFINFSDVWYESGKDPRAYEYKRSPVSINDFESMIINTSLLNFFGGHDLLRNYYRDKVEFQFNELPEIASLEFPTFSYIHIISPHPPFIFDRDGSPTDDETPYILYDEAWKSVHNRTAEDYISRYSAQVEYIDKRLLISIRELLARSDEPPIIIIQADHGSAAFYDSKVPSIEGLQERFAILHAYYFPDGDYSDLYPSVTPVNTFRIIFNKYFGSDFPLLEDKNYFSPIRQMYDFKDVTNVVKNYNMSK